MDAQHPGGRVEAPAASLIEREPFLCRIVESSMDAILVVDDRGRVELFNPAAEALFGHRAADILGCAMDVLLPARFRVAHQGWMQAFGRSGATSRAKSSLGTIFGLHADGFEVPLEASIARVEVEGRLHFSVILRDVRGRLARVHAQELEVARRERRRLAEVAISTALAECDALREAGPRVLASLASVLGGAFGAVWRVEPGTDTLRAVALWGDDPRAQALAEGARGDLLPQCLGLHGEVWRTGEARALALDPGAPHEAAAIRGGFAQGVAFPIVHRAEVTGVIEVLFLAGVEAPALDDELRAMLVAVGDRVGQFMARRHAEDEVRRFLALSLAVLYVLRVDAEEPRVTWVSKNFERLTGYAEHEARDSAWWAERVHPDDRERVTAAHPTPYREGHLLIEYRFRHKDGRYIWLRDEKRLVRDEHGAPTGEVFGMFSDVSERAQLEARLRQSQKMEAIGLLAGGVAHDFNNLLTVISGATELLAATVPVSNPGHELVEEIAQASDRAAALTRQLLVFSRSQVVSPRVLDVNDVVRHTHSMLRRIIGEDVALARELAPALSKVFIDEGQLEQVIMNLAVNARDAMPGGGRITIDTRDVELDADFCRARPELRPARYVLLSMRDTGCGMAPDVLSRVFEPFFTTKGSGKGTGLGLATVFSIVQQASGHVEVESEPGVGSCFKIYLPAASAVSSASDESSALRQAPRGAETVLLVEDEEGVRRVIRVMLERQGYHVLDAAHGEAALAIEASYAHPIDLLVTDLVMPGLSGRQVATALHARRPGLRVLYVSGYIDDALVRHGISVTSEAFLHKPFTPAGLARKVREVLDAPRAPSGRAPVV